ncbi:dienelactone hydrolase family protein [Arenibaculum sp.]|jgi:carboxymethylenebutenolidase|uniref:dienelactone hydrolase family protein n=1 Tax=Arenibaculum sp. TaxID=2865862 RepID=UPI002E10C08F|nr:dienelactone hydrolase family protein [Arenibaculum sp.]
MTGRWIDVDAADGHRAAAWRVNPEGTPKGLVVVAQEIFGVNGHIRDVAGRLAALGWVAVAPALFDRYERGVELGYGSDDVARGRALKAKADLSAALADVAAARAAVPDLPAAVVGFCWGGLVAWAAACRLPGLAAAVSYYGGGIGALAGERPLCPTMLHFGGKDTAIPLHEVEAVRAAHPELPVHLYDAGHGFACDQRASYDEAAAKLAWARTLEFLERTAAR